MKNYFELFNLPESFDIDLANLSAQYKKVQQSVHPDQFASRSAVEKKLALQMASEANQAYLCLKDDIQRGQYLLKLKGHDVDFENNTVMRPEFLMQQMAWREDKPSEAILCEAMQSRIQAFKKALSSEDCQSAEMLLAEMRFIQKLQD